MTIEELKNLKPGDWVNMTFGHKRENYYVQEALPKGVKFGNPHWLSTCGQFLSFEYLADGYHKPKFIGSGKPRRWWKFLPWSDLVVPYSKPK